MFRENLTKIVENVEGGVAGLLMGFDGIAVDSYSKPASSIDINTVGIEFTVVINQVKRAAEMLEAGVALEMSIGTDKMVTIIRMLNDTYFIALTMKPEGNQGKGRYLMRLSAPKILAEL